MTKTVSQLLKHRKAAFWAAGLFCCAFTAAAFAVGMDEGKAFGYVLLFGMALFIAIYYQYGWLLNRRLAYIYSTLLDPDLLVTEVGFLHFQASASWKQEYTRLSYQIARLNLTGDFAEALRLCEQMPAPKPKYSNIKIFNMIYFNVRLGQIQKAEELLPEIEEIIKKAEKLKPNRDRLLGLYCLESCDYPKAYEYLMSSLQEAKSNNGRLGAHFDLARLEEKQGNADRACVHYKRAAAIGPKTWMGQEAAQRLAELAPDGI